MYRLERANEFGILTTDETNRVVKFAEKPKQPDPDSRTCRIWRGRRWGFMSSPWIGLEKLLTDDAANESSNHDFGKQHHPAGDRSASRCSPIRSKMSKPVRKITGAMSATSMRCMKRTWSWSRCNPELNIYDHQWPIWTYQAQQPPAKFVLDEDGRRGMAVNSMVAGGCIISGAYVSRSLLSNDVRIEEYSVIENSVLSTERHHRPSLQRSRAASWTRTA